jgi:cell division protein FtsL
MVIVTSSAPGIVVVVVVVVVVLMVVVEAALVEVQSDELDVAWGIQELSRENLMVYRCEISQASCLGHRSC